MSVIDNVWLFANSFVDSAKFVTINNGAISDLVKSIREWKRDNQVRVFEGMPLCIGNLGVLYSDLMVNLFLYEIIANSVNYCYWYGRHNFRPNEANCMKMYVLLDESFNHLEQLKEHATFSQEDELEIVVNIFIEKLSRARFPLLDQRIQHLNEILDRGDLRSVIEISTVRKDYSAESWLEYLVTSFPGYSKDLFLKRAFLFIMQMYRRCGVFEMDKILVPADYQIPKMLRWMGCLEYHSELAWVVDSDMLLPEGGQEECEIRAATIVACKKLAEESGCTCEEVDSYLFSRRKWCTQPFHLTITSNY